MKTHNPNYEAEVAALFLRSPFIQEIGLKFAECGPGWCETELEVAKRHMQHSGVVHAGVMATMADNTAGAAAYTLVPAGVNVLTVEFKINLLRPGVGERLRCRAEVLKPGRRLTIVESEVFGLLGLSKKLVCKATVTIANESN